MIAAGSGWKVMSADSDIQDLQVKVAFLEDSLSKISDEYYQQQRELEKLKMQFKLLLEKFNMVSSNSNQDSDVMDEKPPHY